MKQLIEILKPIEFLKIPVIILLGITTGILIYTLLISNAVSYLSDDPKACVNCHIMVPQYATWSHSSHREKANCNDCHVPHDNLFRKYFFKAKDGMRHASIFTLRKEPQVIRIHDEGKFVVQENCIRCHSTINENVSTIEANELAVMHNDQKLCWECHREVPHGKVNSLSSAPYSRAPVPSNIIPSWIIKDQKKNKQKN